MTKFQITKATKRNAKARIGLIGPSGSGKTYSALSLAAGFGGRVCVIDTENASASRYADEFSFDVLVLDTHAPQTYVEAIHAVEDASYDVLIIDSLSHAWMGRGGALEQVDQAAKRSQSGNSFTAWRDVTPHHNALIDALVRCRCHLIVTMRAKTEYVMDTDSRGKTQPRKVGLAPIQRDGMEYEFDIVGDLDIDHTWLVTKTRCRALDGAIIAKPDVKTAATIMGWLTDGAPSVDELRDAARRLKAAGGTVPQLTADEVAGYSPEVLKAKIDEVNRMAEALERTAQQARTA